MKTVAVIQARAGSRRLPGKVLMDLAGRPMLWRQLERVARASVHEIVVATSDQPEDDAVAAVAASFGAGCFRGDEHDVLKRFVGAARQSEADLIVRLTADCPLFDAAVADRVIAELTNHLSSCDYAANVLERTYPRGLDVEAFTYGALSWIDRLARTPEEREHVTVLPRGRLRHMFLVRSVKDDRNNSDLRWTVDEAEDLEFVRRIYEELDLVSQAVGYREIVTHLRKHPQMIRFDHKQTTWDPTRKAA